MKSNPIYKDRNVLATVLFGIFIIVLFLATGYMSREIIRSRSIRRMEEGVDTVVSEVVSKLNRDSELLNAAADIISSVDVSDEKAVLEVMETITPLLETMDFCVLLPDNRVLQPEGSILDGVGHLDFATEAAQGEHVSNRVVSIADENVFLLRHFVPIMQDGQVAAMLYGRTMLTDLPGIMNIDNIYNASADVYIIDTETGEFIMDTRHDTLGVLFDYRGRKVRGDDSWDDVIRAIMDQKSGYTIYRSQEDDKVWNYFYYRPAGINQWAIAVSVPEQEALAGVYAVQRVLYVTGTLMVLAVALYYYQIQKNAKKTMQEAVERAVLEEKLHKAEAAERAKTTFLSNMSHDIRTPMNAIIGFTTLAQTNIGNTERVQGYLSKIMSSSSHLLSLINDVLDMSRIESGKLNIEEKECSISDIFRDMRNIIQTQMQAKQLNFFMDTVDVVDEDIWCDKLHLNQVLLNLLSNAIKFTSAGGSVSLTIRQKPEAPQGRGAYEIRVRDNGIGMSPEFAEHVFEPFERERSSTVSGIQGTGLGMAITKSIVDAMGGTIEVQTEQGKGTEFIIDLTFRLQSEPREAEPMEELMGLRALVVDDSFSTCDSVTKMLVKLGMRAEWTLHGKEAVLRARQAMEMGDTFYAYIVDWVLPDLSGLEVIRRIRAEVGDEAPIIVVTAYDWTAFEDEARQAGVTSFCNKPIFLSELRDTLVAALGKAELTPRQSPGLVDPEASQGLRGTRLLVVEDNELNREIAQELLEESGFTVETAEDGTKALELVRASEPGHYNLILMDIQMPIMNGYDTARAIRALPDKALSSIPIVAMTANAFDEDRRAALEAGMNDHVPKPINVEQLMGVIRKLLQ